MLFCILILWHELPFPSFEIDNREMESVFVCVGLRYWTNRNWKYNPQFGVAHFSHLSLWAFFSHHSACLCVWFVCLVPFGRWSLWTAPLTCPSHAHSWPLLYPNTDSVVCCWIIYLFDSTILEHRSSFPDLRCAFVCICILHTITHALAGSGMPGSERCLFNFIPSSLSFLSCQSHRVPQYRPFS